MMTLLLTLLFDPDMGSKEFAQLIEMAGYWMEIEINVGC